MKIYRVEHKESGLGPYRHRVNDQRWIELDWDRYNRCCSANHCPAPHHESRNIKSIFDGGRYKDWYFGFQSVDQIKKWFGRKVLRALKRDNFVIAVYEIDEEHIESSEFQSTFIKANATKIYENIPFPR